MSVPGQNNLYDFVTKHTPSGQARRGDQKLEQTRLLVEQHGPLIHPDHRAIIENRINHANELRKGLEEKQGVSNLVSKVKQAHEFHEAAKTTYALAETLSDRDRDEAQFSSGHSSYTHLQSENHDMRSRAMSIAQSLYLSCNDAFPPPQTRDEWARDVWNETCARVSMNPLPPPQAELFDNSSMSFITEIKTKIVHDIEYHYGFDTSHAPGSISYNARWASMLLFEMSFIYRGVSPDHMTRDLPYRHPMIQKAINTIWFQDQDAVGIVFKDYFSPMPIPAIALALTVIECCICEWREGTRRMTNWDEARFRMTYQSHIASLNQFGRDEQRQLALIQHELLENAGYYLNSGRVTASGRLSQRALESARQHGNVPSYW